MSKRKNEAAIILTKRGVKTVAINSERVTAQKIICNTCKKDFTSSFVLLRDDYKPDIEVHYFVCPHCGQVYIYHVRDKQIKAWLKQGVLTRADRTRILDRQKKLVNMIYGDENVLWVKSGGGA